jgi:glycosyltransferase involved in cell wall biosynthesis
MKKIAFPHKPGSGGPGSFQKRFERELIKQNYEVIYYNDIEKPDIVFVVGGTKKIIWLIQCKLKGIPIIYRLDGINWLHRKLKAKRGIRAFIQSEINNFILKILHAFIADYIVYQSQFVFEWWQRKGWINRKNYSIIYNGIDIKEFKTFDNRKLDNPTLICLEGYLDYSPFAINLINEVNLKVSIDFKVYGGIKFKNEREKLSKSVNYRGIVKHSDLPSIYQNCIYLSLDVNAACPNTVIEALACGAPVVALNTGSLAELVPQDAGIVVHYGSDPWKLGYPDVDALAKAIIKIKENYLYYSKNARRVAEERYSIEEMMRQYLQVFNHF